MHWVRQGSRLVETQIYIGDEWIINQMDREIAAGLVYLNCFDGMNQLHELVAKCEFPQVGDEGIITWLTFYNENFTRQQIVKHMYEILDMVWEIDPNSVIFFVTHPPVQGLGKLKDINYNKNLLFAIR